ncbi:MAG TPA: hypothetical protein VMB77_08695 [Syntrophales bacterium]|nr:hypothetical protein [Syntrophales bacterium]
MIQNIPPMDRLLRPAVCVLLASGAAAAQKDITACLEKIFPEKHCRLIVHEARTPHEIFSTIRNERVHLMFLILHSMEYIAPKKAIIGPSSDAGMIRLLRSVWNVPLVTIARCSVECGREEEIVECGADHALRWPYEIMGLKDRIAAMTSVFYSRNRLDGAEIPEHVKNQLRNWDGLSAVAFESFKKYGRVVIGIESDEADPRRSKLSAITCNPFGGWPDPKILHMVLSYDPECEILIRFTDACGKVRTERLRTGPEGNIPRKAHKISLLNDYLRSVKVQRVMAPMQERG